MNNIINVGSRCSPLAIVQVQEVHRLVCQQGVELKFVRHDYNTQGDLDKSTPLTGHLADDYFTNTLDTAVLKNDIDIAIHSAKDLPESLADGLAIFALTKCLDETDAFVGTMPLSALPVGAKVGTSSELRRVAILNINPHVQIVPIRGTIQERLEQYRSGQYDGVIMATVALKRLGLEDVIMEILPWDTTPLQGQLAIVGRRADVALAQVFAAIDVRCGYRTVMLVGAGPGDPELITLKAVKALRQADCVLYDYLVHKSILEHAPDAEKVYVGKRKGAHSMGQDELSRLLRKKVQEGKSVVRLKGGDPFIFGRGADELSYLQSYHIDVDVIPGISSATAIPSHLGVPLTARGYSSSVAFVTAHLAPDDPRKDEILVPDVDTHVYLMGLTRLEDIIKALKAHGRDGNTPIMVVSRGTRLDEKVVVGTLADINDKVQTQQLQQPALIIVGNTVKFWKDRASLAQSSAMILYTGSHYERYKTLGRIVHLPMIELSKAVIPADVIKRVLACLAQYDFVALTSPNAVRYFFQCLRDAAIDITLKQYETIKFVVIGKGTADAMIENDVTPWLVAQTETSEGLLADLKEHCPLAGKKILLPRSSLPNPFLKDELQKSGSIVEEITVYENRKPAKRPLPSEPIKHIIFTSPSTVKNFLDDYQTIPATWHIYSKGPVTYRFLKAAGYESEVMIYG